MTSKTKTYKDVEIKEYSDLVAEPQYDLFFNNGNNERQEEGTLRVLSLFSGCGGMDIGLEGGFICHNHSATKQEWIHRRINNGKRVRDATLFSIFQFFTFAARI